MKNKKKIRRIECKVCSNPVKLTGFTNTCTNCETDYNGSGQRLAPRSQWGEETGESVADILRVDSPSYDPFEDQDLW